MTKNWKIRKDLSIKFEGHILFRIECTKDFDEIQAGTLGGYIEKEENLSGNAWVADDAKIYDNAEVSGDARVYANAKVYDNARIYDNAKVDNNAEIYGDAWIYDNAYIAGESRVYDKARVYDNSCVSGDALIYGYANVYGNTWICDKAKVCDKAEVFGEACVFGDEIKSRKDVCCISNRCYNITITPLHIKIGCQYHAQQAWWNFTDKEIKKMDGQNALDFWKIWKEPLKQICDTMKKEKEN